MDYKNTARALKTSSEKEVNGQNSKGLICTERNRKDDGQSPGENQQASLESRTEVSLNF